MKAYFIPCARAHSNSFSLKQMEINTIHLAGHRQFILDTARNVVDMVCLNSFLHSNSCDSLDCNVEGGLVFLLNLSDHTSLVK